MIPAGLMATGAVLVFLGAVGELPAARKVGGIWFARWGRLRFSYCVARRVVR